MEACAAPEVAIVIEGVTVAGENGLQATCTLCGEHAVAFLDPMRLLRRSEAHAATGCREPIGVAYVSDTLNAGRVRIVRMARGRG